MRNGRMVMCAGLLVVAMLAMPAAAQSLSPYGAIIGGTIHQLSVGLGCLSPLVPGSTLGGQGFGMSFYGEVQVDSLTITQSKYSIDPHDRSLIKQFNVYANGGADPIGYILLPNDNLPGSDPKSARGNPITAPILRFEDDKPITVTASWLTLVLVSQYPRGDSLSAIESFQFNGTPYAQNATVTNLNEGRRFQATNYTADHSGHPTLVLDGSILCTSDNKQSLFYDGNYTNSRSMLYDPAIHNTGTPFEKGKIDSSGYPFITDPTDGKFTFTVFYDNEGGETVGSVGLGFMAHYEGRNVPRWVYISDNKGNEFKVPIRDNLMQYNRYDHGWLGGEWVAFEDYFFDITSLTITFPDWDGTATDYYRGSSSWFGLTEFQAFRDPLKAATWDYTIPEPATMSLLALGGLAMLRRRRGA